METKILWRNLEIQYFFICPSAVKRQRNGKKEGNSLCVEMGREQQRWRKRTGGRKEGGKQHFVEIRVGELVAVCHRRGKSGRWSQVWINIMASPLTNSLAFTIFTTAFMKKNNKNKKHLLSCCHVQGLVLGACEKNSPALAAMKFTV